MSKIRVPTVEEEAAKFAKMNRPGSGSYRLAHDARRRDFEVEEPTDFDPQKVRAMVEQTSDAHMQDHVAAVKRMTTRPPGIAPLDTLGGKRLKRSKLATRKK